MIDLGLAGKVALVTGANNRFGTGAAIAIALANQDVSVFLASLPASPDQFGVSADEAMRADEPGDAFYRARNADSHDAVLERLDNLGANAAAIEVDLSAPSAIPPLFDTVEATLGPVDILVNNAAYGLPDSLLPPVNDAPGAVAPGDRPSPPMTADSHDRHFAVNSRAPALMMTEYARRYRQRQATWGRIINVSTDGARGFEGEVSYGASKAALESFSRAAAKEFGPFGVTVNIVSLGPVQTGWIPVRFATEYASDIPLRRIGAPDDVADVVLFFASELSRWVTGQTLYVGGGHEM